MKVTAEIQDGAIHLMQVLPGMGAHYTPEQVDMAIDNVLSNHRATTLLYVREQLTRLWESMPESWTKETQEGYVLGYRQAIADATALLSRMP
jgi:hypothetical protein